MRGEWKGISDEVTVIDCRIQSVIIFRSTLDSWEFRMKEQEKAVGKHLRWNEKLLLIYWMISDSLFSGGLLIRMRNQDEIHDELEQRQWILRLKQWWIRREEELERRWPWILYIYLPSFIPLYFSSLPSLSILLSLSLLFTLTLTKQYTKGLNGSIEVFLLLSPSRFLCPFPLPLSLLPSPPLSPPLASSRFTVYAFSFPHTRIGNHVSVWGEEGTKVKGGGKGGGGRWKGGGKWGITYRTVGWGSMENRWNWYYNSEYPPPPPLSLFYLSCISGNGSSWFFVSSLSFFIGSWRIIIFHSISWCLLWTTEWW